MKLNLTQNLHRLEKLLFFLTVLFLPTQLGKHFWPSFSSIFSLRIDYLAPTVYFWDLLVIALVLTYGLIAFLNRKLPLNHKFFFLLLFFLLTQSISALNAVSPEASLVRLKEYLIAGLFALYIASRSFVEIKKPFSIALILSILFICLLAVIQFLLGHSLGLWILGERNFSVNTPLIARFTFYEEVFLRPYATTSHPNMLAGFLITTFPMVIFGFPERLNKLRLLIGLFITGTIFVTFSRPGLILGSIQSALLFKKYWKLLMIAGVIIAPLVIVRLVSIFTFDSLAVLRRQELSEYAIKLFLENPLSGIGLNNFINVLAADKVLIGTSRFLQPAHNIFLLVLSETGTLGILGLLGLFLTAIWNNFWSSNKFSKVLLGNLLLIIFLGLFDHYFLTLPQGQRLFFLMLGLSFTKK